MTDKGDDMTTDPMTTEDEQRELDIFQCHLQMMDQKTSPPRRRAAFERMQKLHRQRSPEQVERMERERGLRD